MRLERLGEQKTFFDLIESRTRDLAACSIVAQLLKENFAFAGTDLLSLSCYFTSHFI
jgi:hypothetical protein